jgi:ethanolamine ammonia-lyase large subunit
VVGDQKVSTLEVVREGLDALVEAVPAMVLERRQLEQSLQEADAQLEAMRAECAAAIEHHAALQLAQATEDREARDGQVRLLERDRIVRLIGVQLDRLEERSVNAQALKALRRMILEDETAEGLMRRMSNV